MQKAVNTQGTDGGSVTVALPDLEGIALSSHRRRLIAMRKRHGADSPVGHRCSNLIEQLQNYQKCPHGAPIHRGRLRDRIRQSMEEIEGLQR
jgi:hypothetical protein